MVRLLLSLLLLFHRLAVARELPICAEAGMLWVQIQPSANSPPLTFLLDTGAGRSVLDLQTARRLKLNLVQAPSVALPDGNRNAWLIHDFDAHIRGIKMPSTLLCLDLKAAAAQFHHPIDGLLGADFLENRILEFNYSKGRGRLLTEGEVRTETGHCLPLIRSHDVWAVRASVEGTPNQLLRVDTGCRPALQWVAPSKPPARTRSSSLRLGSLQLHGVPTGFHRQSFFSREAGLLGSGIFRQFTVTLDTIGHRLVLAPP